MPMNFSQEFVFAGEKQIPPTFEASPVPGVGVKARHPAVTPCPQAREPLWAPAPLFAYSSPRVLVPC